MRTRVLMLVVLAMLCSACGGSGAYAPWAGTYHNVQRGGTATLVIHADGSGTVVNPAAGTPGGISTLTLRFHSIQPAGTAGAKVLSATVSSPSKDLSPQVRAILRQLVVTFTGFPHNGWGSLSVFGQQTVECTDAAIAKLPVCKPQPAPTGSP